MHGYRSHKMYKHMCIQLQIDTDYKTSIMDTIILRGNIDTWIQL